MRANQSLEDESPWLSREEIRVQALEDRKRRARSENMRITAGDMNKGEHLVETPAGKQYDGSPHDPVSGRGISSCPDYSDQSAGHL
ncbi:MAG: hypothetical protein R2875_15295 [Desulfobacterales bacterium]